MYLGIRFTVLFSHLPDFSYSDYCLTKWSHVWRSYLAAIKDRGRRKEINWYNKHKIPAVHLWRRLITSQARRVFQRSCSFLLYSLSANRKRHIQMGKFDGISETTPNHSFHFILNLFLLIHSKLSEDSNWELKICFWIRSVNKIYLFIIST